MPTRVHSETLKREYYASFLSTASCFNLFTLFIMVFFPLFLGFASHAFWVKEKIYREQPGIQFMRNAWITAAVHDSTTNEWRQVSWTTSDTLNDGLAATYRPMTLNVLSKDDNIDGLSDSLRISVDIPLGAGERAHGITAALFMDTRLTSRAMFKMDSLVLVEHESQVPGAGFSYSGDLLLSQRHAMNTLGGTQEPYSDSLFSEMEEAGNLAMSRLVDLQQSRDVRLAVRHGAAVWDWDATQGANNRLFTATFSFKIPQSEVYYVPDAAETLKHGWIQYYSMAVLTYFCITRFRSFVYENNILETSISVNSGIVKGRNPVKHSF